MCEKAFKKYLWLLKYVPDWFVTHQQPKTWHDNDDYCNDDDELSVMVIKSERLKKRKLKKVDAHCLPSIKVLRLVYVRR